MEEQDGDVVGTTALFGEEDEVLGGAGEVFAGDDLADFGGVDVAGEAV